MSIHLIQPLMFSSMDMKPALDEACAEAVGCDYHVVNECATGTHDCSSYATCLDTFGRSTLFLVLVIPLDPVFLISLWCKKVTIARMFSFTCDCRSGFVGSGTVCTDINECLQGSTMCGLKASCRNTFGSYECACQIGFYLNSAGVCVSCPAGTSTSSLGTLSTAGCTVCDAGENDMPTSCRVLNHTLSIYTIEFIHHMSTT